MFESTEHEQFVRKNYRFNFIVNLLDGANFWFAQSFISAGVILPLYVSRFTDNKLIIGLVTVFSVSGFFLPQLFTANWVENSPLKKNFPYKIGFFSERIPLLLLAPTAIAFATRSPNLALVIFLILIAWTNFGAGMIAVGWQDMIGKIIPIERRGIFYGLTNFLGTGAGVLGSIVATWLLGQYPFPTGYVFCFAMAGIFNIISWFFLGMTREYPVLKKSSSTSQKDYWQKLPPLLRRDRNFVRYLLSQTVVNLGGMAWGFVAIYAMQHWSQPEAKISSFNIALLIGQAFANLLFGIIADRKGYKTVILISIICSLLSFSLIILAPSPDWFYLIFILRGANLAGLILTMMFSLEFSAPEIRPTYIGVSNTTSGVISAISPLIGGAIAEVYGFPALFWISLALTFSGLIMMGTLVRDPRLALQSSAIAPISQQAD